MKMFIDTANVDEIKAANELGVICGVTTNPSLIAKEGKVFKDVVDEALAGARIATIPYKVICQMIYHPLTDAGIERFLKDWESVPNK